MNAKETQILKFSSFWESVDYCLIAADLNGIILAWNPGAEKIYGYKSKSMIGVSIFNLFAEGKADEYSKIIKKVKRNGKVFHYESERIGKNNIVKNVAITIIPIKDKCKNVIGIASVTRDITQRIKLFEKLNESEKKYKNLIEQLFSSFALVNNDGKIVTWNTKLLEQLGYSPKEVPKLNFNDFITDEVKKILTIAEINKSKMNTFQFSSEIKKKDGRLFPAEISIQVLEGNMLMFLIRDISERKAAEEFQEKLINRLVNTQNILKNLSKQMIQVQEIERRNIARELHDEIGQTLTAIKIDIVNSLNSTASEIIKDRLKDTIKLVEDTLNKVREMSLNLRPSILDDLGLIPALRWFLDGQMRRTNINAKLIAGTLSIKLPIEFEITCYRIVQEAVTNIIKHSNAKNMRVNIHIEQNELHLSISDDGIGFDVNSARENAVGGFSIGILNMQERAELVGGWLDIVSNIKEGTKIHAIFPLKLS